ncbi:MAG: hypothetical protein ACRCWR_06255, partial [Saezia sp.]
MTHLYYAFKKTVSLLGILLLCSLLHAAAIASTPALPPSVLPEKAYTTMEHRLTHQDISQQLGLPYPLPTFKPD